jgi:hypothetical protein
LNGLAIRWKSRERICKALQEFLQNSLQIAGGIGLFRALPCQLQSTFDSGMFSLRFLNRSLNDRQRTNWRVEFFTNDVSMGDAVLQ